MLIVLQALSFMFPFHSEGFFFFLFSLYYQNTLHIQIKQFWCRSWHLYWLSNSPLFIGLKLILWCFLFLSSWNAVVLVNFLVAKPVLLIKHPEEMWHFLAAWAVVSSTEWASIQCSAMHSHGLVHSHGLRIVARWLGTAEKLALLLPFSN